MTTPSTTIASHTTARHASRSPAAALAHLRSAVTALRRARFAGWNDAATAAIIAAELTRSDARSEAWLTPWTP